MKFGHTEKHLGDAQCEDKVKDGRLQAEEKGLGGNQIYRHHDLALLAPRIVRGKKNSCYLSHLVCGVLFERHRKQIQVEIKNPQEEFNSRLK